MNRKTLGVMVLAFALGFELCNWSIARPAQRNVERAIQIIEQCKAGMLGEAK